MTARKKIRTQEAQLGFEALSIEGGLLSPEWLSRAAQVAAGGQNEADYRIPKGLNLRDEIGRYWRISQAHWSELRAGHAAKADPRVLAERFVEALLREAFGFASLTKTDPVAIAARSYPIGFAALGGCVPVVIASYESGLDSPALAFGDAGRRRSAFGLAQEYLNAQDSALWGLACDGSTLRILRDNASLTRPAWIEADLKRIFTEERYSDFAALWLLAHETRFGRASQPVTESQIETWRKAGREEGTRAREHLRRGVEDALVALGQGFLSCPENRALRSDLQNGSLTTKAYFNQLLRLVYRLIFLLTVEERDLLHPAGADQNAKALYAQGYGLRRLRERSVKRSAHDRFSDLWEGMKIVFRGLATGEPRLGLPALAGIFAKSQCSALEARLENRALLLAVFRLAWLREDASLSRVNWRDMGPEELGSVYESLLELVPQITKDGRQFAFASGNETKGNARKTSGSYYTPDSLVQALLNSALEPVVAETIAKNPGNPSEALLGLSIVDPACGSGHFLLAAARRLAAHVARMRANGTPSAAEYRHALRQVVSRCIFGVDLNSMAVELCKVSLWMEAVEPGLPLTFLNSHVQHGNALLGTTPELMAQGVPDAAWEPIEGDDNKTASALKKKNKDAAEGQRSFETLWSQSSEAEAKTVMRAVADLDAASDADVDALTRKEGRWDGIIGSSEYRHQKFVADAWCSAFVWPKKPGVFADAAPTNDLWRQLRDNQGQPSIVTTNTVTQVADRYQFFHWHLQFPQVFASGGFNIVLGNPPWERVKLQEKEFFASRNEQIAGAPNAAARKQLIAKLPQEDPQLWDDWCAASRQAEGASHLLRQSQRYPLCGKGDVNTYAIFSEHNWKILSRSGRAGFIVPTGIATDDTTKDYFGALVRDANLASLYSFENEDKVFPNVHNQFKFALVCIDGAGKSKQSDLVFFARQAADLADRDRHFALTAADFETLNPNTRTCPTFRSRRDADINLAMYRRGGILWHDADERQGNHWGVRFMTMFHMASDSNLFSTRAQLESAGGRLQGNRFLGRSGEHLPLIEAKLVHIFDHRFSTYENASQANLNKGTLPRLDDAAHRSPMHLGLPEYWVSRSEVDSRLLGRWTYGWLLGWRDISRSVDERTIIPSIIPRTAVGHKLPLVMPGVEPSLSACLYASLCSFALDYAARQKVGGASLTYFILKQLPVHGPAVYLADTPWQQGKTLREWVLPRVLELTYTAWDLEPFARDVQYDGPPFRWNPERRFLLRCELDAAFFHLYGISRGDMEYIMDTFPIVRRNDEKVHGEYRTKRVIVETYDAMTIAARAGEPYRTLLDPPPADPRVAHPPLTGVVVPLWRRTPSEKMEVPAWGDALIAEAASRAQVALTAGAWATSLTGEALGMAALAAALRHFPGNQARDDVERTVVMTLLPRLMQEHFDTATRKQWRDVIGASNLAFDSIGALGVPWKTVLRRAIQQKVLAEDEGGRWGPGSDIADVPSPVLDARALVVLSWFSTSPTDNAEVSRQVVTLRAA